MNSLPTNPQAAAELLPVDLLADERAQFEAAFPYCDHAKHRNGEMIAGRVRYADPDMDKMFSAWLSARLQSQPSPEHGRGDVERYRHKKRGTIYEVIGEAVLQASEGTGLLADETPMVVYQGEDGKLWTREFTEFHDGRFEPLAALQPAPRQEGEDDEPSAWAVEAFRQSGEMYASYMGDPDGNDDTETARSEAAKVIERLALAAMPTAPVQSDWQPIEDAWSMGDTPIIVTDGLSVHGAAWWHPREEAWIGCDGIVPTHWMPLPDPIALTKPEAGSAGE